MNFIINWEFTKTNKKSISWFLDMQLSVPQTKESTEGINSVSMKKKTPIHLCLKKSIYNVSIISKDFNSKLMLCCTKSPVTKIKYNSHRTTFLEPPASIHISLKWRAPSTVLVALPPVCFTNMYIACVFLLIQNSVN